MKNENNSSELYTKEDNFFNPKIPLEYLANGSLKVMSTNGSSDGDLYIQFLKGETQEEDIQFHLDHQLCYRYTKSINSAESLYGKITFSSHQYAVIGIYHNPRYASYNNFYENSIPFIGFKDKYEIDTITTFLVRPKASCPNIIENDMANEAKLVGFCRCDSGDTYLSNVQSHGQVDCPNGKFDQKTFPKEKTELKPLKVECSSLSSYFGSIHNHFVYHMIMKIDGEGGS